MTVTRTSTLIVGLMLVVGLLLAACGPASLGDGSANVSERSTDAATESQSKDHTDASAATRPAEDENRHAGSDDPRLQKMCDDYVTFVTSPLGHMDVAPRLSDALSARGDRHAAQAADRIRSFEGYEDFDDAMLTLEDAMVVHCEQIYFANTEPAPDNNTAFRRLHDSIASGDIDAARRIAGLHTAEKITAFEYAHSGGKPPSTDDDAYRNFQSITLTAPDRALLRWWRRPTSEAKWSCTAENGLVRSCMR